MQEFDAFDRRFPLRQMTIGGISFPYRHHVHSQNRETLLLLTGGIGLSDLFFCHFAAFAKDFSVLTCDYPLSCTTMAQLTDTLAQLLRTLGIRAWLVGHSFGGVVAQLLARRHSDVVAGLVLSNTASLAADMTPETRASLLALLEKEERYHSQMQAMPFALVKPMLRRAILKKAVGLTPAQQKTVNDLCQLMTQKLTKSYGLHMLELLCDCRNHLELSPQDFLPWKDCVLLLLSEDDHTFTDGVKASLISLMPEPQVVTELPGGHLALLLQSASYLSTVTAFIQLAAMGESEAMCV